MNEHNTEKNVKRLFTKRGYYSVSKTEYLDGIKGSTYMRITAKFISNTRQKERIICLVFCDANNVGKSELKGALNQIELTPSTRCILITKGISFQAISMLDSLKYTWEVLSFDDIEFDIFAHNYVPDYRVLSPRELEGVERIYGSKDKFPRMIASVDPVARYMGFRTGDVLEIKTYDISTGGRTSYRIVVSNNSVHRS
jgi:DNA-directed RNA polymerase subunit H